MKSNKLIKAFKSGLGVMAIALVTTHAQWTQAGTTLVFADNLTPSSPYPSTNPADTADFLPGTEFRVVLNGFVSGGGMKSIIGAASATGGAAPTPPGWPFTTWVFDNSGIWTAAQNSATTPGATLPTNGGSFSAAPAGDIGMAQNAAFLGSPFGFLAPTTGSAAATAYGNSQLTFTGGPGFNIRVGVTEAQWATGVFTIGLAQGGVDFIGTLAPNNHTFRIISETVIQPSDDSLGFAGQNTQWDLVGELNTDPAPNISAYSTDTSSALSIPVANIATDRESDTISITTPTPVVSGTAGGSVTCTGTGCTYTPAGIAGVDTFTVAVADDFTAIPGSANITLSVTVTGNPVANDDNPGNNPGTLVDQNTIDNVINLTANDVAPTGQTINPDTINITTLPTNGIITMPLPNDGSGTVLYTPNPGFSGIDSFDYEVDDSQPVTSNIATVDITVNCTAAVCAEAGAVTPGGGFATIRLTEADLIGSGVGPDDGVDGVATSCDPDCFSFVAPTSSPAVVVLTLSGPLKANSRYRKVDATGISWRAFDTTAGDTVESALGSLGSCPPPGDASYNPGLLAGNFCVQLTIEDAATGGLNDDDNVLGQVTDPGGIGVGATAPVVLPGQNLSSGAGCSISTLPDSSTSNRVDWWLLSGFLVWLGWKRSRTS